MNMMNTKIERVNPEQIDETIMEEAGRLIAEGELVAFPTETVYGLGGDALHPGSCRKIYAAKGRPSDNPLIVHIADFSDMERVAREVPEAARKLAGAFWPGPLTMIVWKSDAVPMATTGGMDTVAVRMPNHPVALDLIQQKRMSDRCAKCQHIRSSESDRSFSCCRGFIRSDCHDFRRWAGRYRHRIDHY